MTPEEMQKKIENLEFIVNFLVKNDRYLFQRDLEMFNGRNIKFSSGTGTKIGGTGSKLAFYGASPIVLQTAVPVTAGGIHAALVSLGLITA